MTTVYCYNCGAQIPNDAKFCNECGFPVQKSETIIVETSNNPNRKEKKHKPHKITKKIILLSVVALCIIALFAVPKIIKNNRVRNEVKPIIEMWEKKNGISINSFSVKPYGGDDYSITIRWDDFKYLTPSRMSAILKSWDSHYSYYLKYIISGGTTYSVDCWRGSVMDLYSKSYIAFGSSSYSSSSSNYSSSSSSSSSKTATCNYCNGTGKVNGEKCPWCNGSGKTYDNIFNDLLGDN